MLSFQLIYTAEGCSKVNEYNDYSFVICHIKSSFFHELPDGEHLIKAYLGESGPAACQLSALAVSRNVVGGFP